MGDRTSMNICLRRTDTSVAFLAVGHSNFAYLDRLSVDKDFVLFEEDALISYAGIVAKYDFKKKGLQRFQSLTHRFDLLPPERNTISLRLVGEKPLELDGKKIDALLLALKHPDYKEALIWINKWSHALLKIENPEIGLVAILTSSPKTLTASEHSLEKPGIIKNIVSFKNKDVLLEGTLTIPEGDGQYPAILLVWGPGPLNREALGMFTNLAGYLASNGFAVLSFDKRGIGKSQGNFSRFTREDVIGDLRAALDFIYDNQHIDKTKIGILGHSEGSYYASYIACNDQRIKTCIIMAGMVVANIYETDLETINLFNDLLLEWDKEYLFDISRATKQTMKIVQDGRDWTLLLGKRVFLKKTRLDFENNPLDAARKLKVPTLIMQGKADIIVLPEHAKLLKRALEEGGNEKSKLVFFDGLGHFFGNIIQDGIHQTYLTTDEKAMETILLWLKDNLVAPKDQIEQIPETAQEDSISQPTYEPVLEPDQL